MELKKRIKQEKIALIECNEAPSDKPLFAYPNPFAPLWLPAHYQNGTTNTIINLTALAIFNAKEARLWDLEHFLNNFNTPIVSAILQWRDPRWLGEYLLTRFNMRKWYEIKLLNEDLKWYLFQHKSYAIVRGFSMLNSSVRYITIGGNISEVSLYDFTHFAEIENDNDAGGN